MTALPVRIRIVVGVVAAVIAIVMVAPIRAGAAGDVVAVGWWSDRASAVSAGPGGFEVAAAFDGTSVAAVRLVNDGAFESATLVLTETGVPPGVSAAINACAIAPGWVPADPGPLADAPARTCDGGVALTRNVDRTWTADLTGLLADSGQLDLALVPAEGPLDASPLGEFDPGFTAQFSGAALETVAPEEPTPTAAAPTTSPPATSTPTATTAPLSTAPPTTAAAPPQAIVPRPFPPPSIPPTTEAPPVTQVGSPVDETAAEELSVPSLTNGPISGSSGGDKPWIRLVGLIPLSAAAGVGTVFVNRLRSGRV